VNERTLEMMDKVNRRVLDTQRISLSFDLKTLTMTVREMGRSQPNVLVFERQ